MGALKPPAGVAVTTTVADTPGGNERIGFGELVKVNPVDTELTFVSKNCTAVVPGVLACMENVPVRLSATGIGEVINPNAFPVTVVKKAPPKVAVAPEEGAVNVTFALGLAFPYASKASTTNGAVKEAPMFADWEFPETTVSFAGLPPVTVVEDVAVIVTVAISVTETV